MSRAREFIPEVERVLKGRGEPAYRFGQAYDALCSGLARDWEEATTLPKNLRTALQEEAPAAVLELTRPSRATDGTRKYLFKTHDGHLIETVMIPEKDRRTVCISTQVGCPMACKFCATGLLGIKRNLKAREIAEQVFVATRDVRPERISNVVVMGMGEPMLNYKELMLALRVLNDADGFNLAARHIAVSTSGLVDKIRRFADEPEQFHLAISLHTPFEEERAEIMPVASRHSVSELMDAARYYVETTRRKLFFEYTLLAGVNDQPRHVEALAELLYHPLYHLNLLRFNWTDTGYAATPKREAKEFLNYARELGLSATLRPSRGQDIDAACGQLAAKDLRPAARHNPFEPVEHSLKAEPAERLDPRAKLLWHLTGALQAVPILAGGAFGSYVLFFGAEASLPLAVLPALGALALAALLVFVLPPLLWRRWRYEIRPLEADLQRGLIRVTRTLVPMARVQHVDTRRGPLQRRLGLSTVVFYTAAGPNEIPQLASGTADEVRDRIAKLTREADEL